MTVIINADDFGMFDSANSGILYSLKEKLINSVSVCVNFETSQILTDILKFRKQLISIGLHLNVTEGYSLVSRMEYSNSLVLYNDRRSYNFYCEEIESQIREFKSIYDFLPEHLDCHQHFVYFDENACKAFVALSNKYGIPIRSTYSFSNKERLEKLFLDVRKRHGINVPFDIEKIVASISSLRAVQRTRFLLLDLASIDDFEKKSDLEIVCHPQLSKDGERNKDLKILERTRELF